MAEDRAWLREQIRERIRFYASLTSVGLPVAVPDSRANPADDRSSSETLDEVRNDLGECTRCRLHQSRQTIVFGSGDPTARLMFVGEAPGRDEDREGLPFVGEAGQLLTRIIEAIGLRRQDVYIANVIKCRPPQNRDPEPDEIASCRPFVERQIRSVDPRVICTLGRFAAQALLGTTEGIHRLRGRKARYGDAWLVPTYHPAYLLRFPHDKKKTWEDMKLVRRLLDEPS